MVNYMQRIIPIDTIRESSLISKLSPMVCCLTIPSLMILPRHKSSDSDVLSMTDAFEIAFLSVERFPGRPAATYLGRHLYF